MLWKNGGKGEIFTVLEGKNIILEKGHLGGGAKILYFEEYIPLLDAHLPRCCAVSFSFILSVSVDIFLPSVDFLLFLLYL